MVHHVEQAVGADSGGEQRRHAERCRRQGGAEQQRHGDGAPCSHATQLQAVKVSGVRISPPIAAPIPERATWVPTDRQAGDSSASATKPWLSTEATPSGCVATS